MKRREVQKLSTIFFKDFNNSTSAWLSGKTKQATFLALAYMTAMSDEATEEKGKIILNQAVISGNLYVLQINNSVAGFFGGKEDSILIRESEESVVNFEYLNILGPSEGNASKIFESMIKKQTIKAYYKVDIKMFVLMLEMIVNSFESEQKNTSFGFLKDQIERLKRRDEEVVYEKKSTERKTRQYNPGEVIEFGEYLQGVDGKEPIEWIILKVIGNKALILSKYILDYQCFAGGDTYRVNPISWEKSYIRNWLNNNFYSAAFNEQQKKIIVRSKIQTSNPCGVDTTFDNIFLLSLEDIQENRKANPSIALETENTLYTNRLAKVFAADSWWLRSDFKEYDMQYPRDWFVCYLDSSGDVQRGIKRNDIKNGVRPAMWIDIDKYSLQVPEKTQCDSSTYAVGSTVVMGTYKIDSDDKKPLEWIVIHNDGVKALLLSKNALGAKEYNETQESITWENSSIRKWLNSYFLSIFSAKELNQIIEVNLNNEGNEEFQTQGGNSTKDKIFLLSKEEVERYLPHKFERYGKAIPLYIKENPHFVISEESLGMGSCYTQAMLGNCNYWLRSPGAEQKYAAFIDFMGQISFYGSVNREMPFRPAMYITLT